MTRREIITKAIARQLSWIQAAEIVGVTPRQMRWIRWQVEHSGLEGIMGQRGGRPRRKRIKAGKSHLGNEDRTLFNRLAAELPGILNWAIAGRMRLQERGHFLQPESVREMAEDFGSMANPLGAFIEEACEVGSDKMTTTPFPFLAIARHSRHVSRGIGSMIVDVLRTSLNPPPLRSR